MPLPIQAQPIRISLPALETIARLDINNSTISELSVPSLASLEYLEVCAYLFPATRGLAP
jgi:hypothetical protein